MYAGSDREIPNIRKVKLYGERNTSTNYLLHLLEDNLDVEVDPGVVPPRVVDTLRFLPGREWIRDAYFALTYSKNLGWKHRCPEERDSLTRRLERMDMAAVLLVKNPYSWLLSLHRRPYHLRDVKTDFEEFLRSPLPTRRRENLRGKHLTPIDLWNTKHRRFVELQGERFVTVTAENLLVDPEQTVRDIAERLDLSHSSSFFTNRTESTKDPTKDYDYYQSFYLEEKWREDLSQEAIDLANESLNFELMQTLGYTPIN